MSPSIPTLSLAIALLLASVPTAAEPPRVFGQPDDAMRKEKYRAPGTAFERLLEAADAHYDAREDATAAEAYDRIVASPEFAALRMAQQHDIWANAATTAWRLQHFEQGLAFSRRAQALMKEDAFDTRRVVAFLLQLERPGEAAATIADFAHRRPDGLSVLDAGWLYRVSRELAGQPRTQADFLQMLFDAQWDDPIADSSSLWYDLALARVRLGEPERARAAIARVVAPEFVVRLRDDKRFDALVDRDALAFDVRAAALRKVAALRAKADRRPRSLELQHALQSALLDAGQWQAVLDLAEQARQAIAAGGAVPPYDDPDMLTWMLDTRAIALRRLGRIDEAVALMEHIQTDPEKGQPNVSQAINLGMLYYQLGRPRDALASIARIDDAGMSDYGRIQLASVRLHAAIALGDRDLQRTAFDFIRAHRADSQGTYIDALLLLGRIDEAAERCIERLASEDERADALFELQETVRPEPLPGDLPWLASSRAMVARADVRAAIERVGRIEHHDVSLDYAF